jgi:hypothetical protein
LFTDAEAGLPAAASNCVLVGVQSLVIFQPIVVEVELLLLLCDNFYQQLLYVVIVWFSSEAERLNITMHRFELFYCELIGKDIELLTWQALAKLLVSCLVFYVIYAFHKI